MVDKLPFLSDDHHYAIAAVAARSAQLDITIETSISILLAGMQRTSEAVLKGMNGDKYVGLLEQMLLDVNHDDARQATITKVFARVKALRTQRNEVMHWLYGSSDDPTKSRHVLLRPHRVSQEKSRTANEVQAIAKEMLDLVLVIGALATLSPKPYALPDKPGQPTHPHDSPWRTVLDRYESGEPLQRPQGSSPA